VTEDSRNHMRGYGSFPEGAEPTEEIAAFGDPSVKLPPSRSSARPSIPSQPPTPAAARPSRPWSAPPPTFARSTVSYAEPPTTAQRPTIAEPPTTAQPPTMAQSPTTAQPPSTAQPPAMAQPLDGLSSPVRRPLYGGIRRATVEPPGDIQPLVIEPPAIGRSAPWHDEPVEPPSETHPDLGEVHAPQAAAQPDSEYPVWPASLERPEGHQPPPSPARPTAPPWDSAATGWPEEPPANAGIRPEAAAEEYAYPVSAPPGPFFAPTRPDPGEDSGGDPREDPGEDWAPDEAHAPSGDWSQEQEPTETPSGDWSYKVTNAPSADRPPAAAPNLDPWAAQPPTPARSDQPHGGLPTTPSRRITPTPSSPHPTRLVAGLLIGLIAGLLLFGTAGWFTGRTTAPTPTPPKPTIPAKPAIGLFEQTQATLNAAHFTTTNLTKFAQPWLPYLANCAKVAPAQADGEKARVRCTIDGMSAFFVEYKSTAERDKARGKLQPQVREASTLAPGAKDPGKTPTGNYVEYAYRLTEGGVTRTVAGIWWDDAQTPIAAYLLAYWKDGLGERWEPMRDLWSRYA